MGKLDGLRERAEILLRSQPVLANVLTFTDDPEKLAYELEVHQVELLMQNDELRHGHLELEKSRNRYADLYNFAPVAYVMLDTNGKILEANVAAAGLLGTDRYIFLRRPLSAFMTMEHADVFHLFRREVFRSGTTQGCDLSLRSQGGKLVPVHLDAVAFERRDGRPPMCGCVILDRSTLGDATPYA